MPINQNRIRDRVNAYLQAPDNAAKSALYPRFFEALQFDQFRHITNLHIDFSHPITAIAGSNRSGKSSVLMAIACSHYHFMRKNVVNGNVERARWGDMIRFTSRDRQIANWTYTVTFREGEISETLRGTRNVGKKWSGVAKKEGQIGTTARGDADGRRVYMVDLNRITPGRHLSPAKYNKARRAVPSRLLHSAEIIEYLQYIFDTPYDVSKLCDVDDGKVFAFTSLNDYTSFNSASGRIS